MIRVTFGTSSDNELGQRDMPCVPREGELVRLEKDGYLYRVVNVGWGIPDGDPMDVTVLLKRAGR